jgi:RHS repeat-associated protein
VAKEEGYAYLYVSNENPTRVDAYFDDVVMTHTKSNIIQYNEYYPFSLQTANSWTREGAVDNRFLSNGGTELNLTTGWYDLFFRNYDPALGRMHQADPMAAKYASLTPYNYSFNNPVRFNDPAGDDPPIVREGRTFIINWNEIPEDGGTSWKSDGTVESLTFDQALKAGLDYKNKFNSWAKDSPFNGSKEHFTYAHNGQTYGGQRIKEHGMVIFLRVSRLNQANNGAWSKANDEEKDVVEIYTEEQLQQQQQTQGSGPGGMTDFTNSNWALTIGGAVYGAMEGATASQGYWLGKNGKYYPDRWGGNQYTGSRAGAFKAANSYKLAGRATVFLSAGIGVYSTIEGYQLDGGRFGYNAQMAAASSTGGIVGGLAGAKGGAAVGAAIGVWFGGVGAVPGAIIGGVIGGIGGSLFGSYAGESAVNYYHGR